MGYADRHLIATNVRMQAVSAKIRRELGSAKRYYMLGRYAEAQAAAERARTFTKQYADLMGAEIAAQRTIAEASDA